MSKLYHTVCVTTPTAVELNSGLHANTKAGELFDQVASELGLRQVEFFGLSYKDPSEETAWLPLNKRIFDRSDLPKQYPIKLNFSAKYYPEDVRRELTQREAIELFYAQVKSLILSDEIYCPPSTSVLLASLALQIRYGDYENIVEGPEPKEVSFVLSQLLPRRVLAQHNQSLDDWKARIIEWWIEQKGRTAEKSMIEYLRAAEDLEMYGVSYFEIGNRKGSQILLGVHALGLSIYDRTDRLNPRIVFPWSEIYKILYINRRFVIKPLSPNSPDLVFIARRERTNKRIFTLCVGNHELYKRRRASNANGEGIKLQRWRGEELDDVHAVQNEEKLQQRKREKEKEANVARERQEFEKLKEAELEKQMQEKLKELELEKQKLQKAKELELRKLRKDMERDTEANEAQLQKLRQEILDRETVSRMKARQAEEDSEERVKRMQEEMEMWQKHHNEATLTIRKLKSELQQGNDMKEQLEFHQKELLAMVEQLTESREMELDERKRLVEEIHRREEEIRNMEVKVKQKDEETARLEQESFAAREREQEVMEALQRLKIKKDQISRSGSGEYFADTDSGTDEEGRQAREIREALYRLKTKKDQNSRSGEYYMEVDEESQNGKYPIKKNVHPEPEVSRESIDFQNDSENPEDEGEGGKIPAGLELYYQILREERANARHHTEILQSRVGMAKPGEADRQDSPEPYYETDERQLKKLRRLTQELTGVEIEGINNALTVEDKIFKENFRLGRDKKYDTLRRVREGNTKRRVDMFENM